MFRRLTLASESSSFEVKAGAPWKFGSGVLPKSYYDSSPFEENSVLNDLKKNRYEAERNQKLFLVPIKGLQSWQRGIDSDKVRPIESSDYPPVKVYQFNGNLVLMDGNHRAISAFVQGLKYIKAQVTNFDDPKTKKYRKDSTSMPASGDWSSDLEPVSDSKTMQKG